MIVCPVGRSLSATTLISAVMAHSPNSSSRIPGSRLRPSTMVSVVMVHSPNSSSRIPGPPLPTALGSGSGSGSAHAPTPLHCPSQTTTRCILASGTYRTLRSTLNLCCPTQHYMDRQKNLGSPLLTTGSRVPSRDPDWLLRTLGSALAAARRPLTHGGPLLALSLTTHVRLTSQSVFPTSWRTPPPASLSLPPPPASPTRLSPLWVGAPHRCLLDVSLALI